VRCLSVLRLSVVRLLVLTAVTTFLATAATAGVVGSGTPSSCTEAALTAQFAAGGTITFNCGGGPQTIPITFTMFIGSTNPKLTVDGGDTITLDGTGNTSGMMTVSGDTTALPDVTFKHITFTKGNVTSGLNAGGAIQNFGKLTLDTVTFTQNQSLGSGGAIFQEPCTGCLDPLLTITHSLFQNNSGGSGGAMSIQGGFVNVTDSTFSGNTGRLAGAIELYGNSTFRVVASIDRSTFTGNSGTFGGAAIAVENLHSGSSVTITNDTFTANTSTGANAQGAALYLASAPVTVTNCTIAGNTTTAGGGAVFFSTGQPLTSVTNTIIASNSGGNCSFSGASILAGGHNLQFGDATCPGMTVANPLLGALANNGGPTQTMALGAGSPAIDGGDTINAPTTDQRGVARTDGNGNGIIAVDIGAFEAPGVSGSPAPRRRHAVRP
jgi:predicted outer membrane repeat protein